MVAYYGGLLDFVTKPDWPKATVLDFVQKQYLPTVPIDTLENYADSIYPAYLEAGKEGFPPFDPGKADTLRTVKRIQSSTGIQYLYCYSILKGLYALAKSGAIEARYWNVRLGQQLAKTEGAALARYTGPLGEAVKIGKIALVAVIVGGVIYLAGPVIRAMSKQAGKRIA